MGKTAEASQHIKELQDVIRTLSFVKDEQRVQEAAAGAWLALRDPQRIFKAEERCRQLEHICKQFESALEMMVCGEHPLLADQMANELLCNWRKAY